MANDNAARVEFLIGNVIEQLRTLPNASVHAVITSPPYWGLRDYSTQPQIWLNGHEPCADHEWTTAPFPFDTRGNPHGVAGSTLRDGNVSADEAWARKNQICADGDHEWVEHLQPSANGQTTHAMVAETLNETSATRKPKRSDFCAKCGAWRGQLGLEPTPEIFVEHLVAVFREVRRVLRDDGVCFINLGDSYWGGKGQSAHGDPDRHIKRLAEGKTINKPYQEIGRMGETKPGDGKHDTIKPKDLAMIPARVALALQADGWYLRSVCPGSSATGCLRACAIDRQLRTSTGLC